MKIKLSKSQWESIGKLAGWVSKDGDIEDADIITEKRLVTFFDENTGKVLEEEVFFTEGRNELERFEKLEEEISVYITDHFADPDSVDYEHKLLDVI